MLISEYLQMRNIAVNPSVGTGGAHIPSVNTTPPGESPFAKALQTELEKQDSGVTFSRHAMERISDRSIDMAENDKLSRLNRAVEVATQKGSNETLVLLDRTAFLVSVKNNKVITTMTEDDMRGNIFTNIDSTVIM